MSANNGGSKWRSRRWATALLGIALVVADKIYCVERGLDIEWFKIFTEKVVLLALFGAGFITATNMMYMWWQRHTNGKNGET
jgi:hypothetical protein